MNIEEKNLAVWSASASAIALVPAARFKVPGNWEGITRPYVVQQPIVETGEDVHSGELMPLRTWEFYQFSVIADSYKSAKDVAEKMRTVFVGNIDGVQYFYRGQRWIGEENVEGVGMMAVDFRICETLSA